MNRLVISHFSRPEVHTTHLPGAHPHACRWYELCSALVPPNYCGLAVRGICTEEALLVAIVFGIACWFALGVDFPDSTRRFARLPAIQCPSRQRERPAASVQRRTPTRDGPETKWPTPSSPIPYGMTRQLGPNFLQGGRAFLFRSDGAPDQTCSEIVGIALPTQDKPL
jgi:hypothetical protein